MGGDFLLLMREYTCMEFTTNGRGEMLYTCRMTYSDETFAVATFPAASFDEAIELCRLDESVRSVMVLGTIDTEPQVCLAYT